MLQHQIRPEYGDEQADAGRDCRTRLAKPNSRRRERGQGNIHFLCSANHVQDWQPYPVDPYSCYMCDHTYMRNTASASMEAQSERVLRVVVRRTTLQWLRLAHGGILEMMRRIGRG